MIHSLTLERLGPVSDGQGGAGEAMSAYATVMGRVWPASQKDMMVAGQSKGNITHAVIVPPGTAAMAVEDEVVFGSRRFIIRVPGITPSVEIYHKALAEEIHHGT
jgi:SPP1 family predicted phage head-tail adaptor